MTSVSGVLAPFSLKTVALPHPEAVLLVHDDQREVVELDALLDQGVRPDNDVGLALSHHLKRRPALRSVLRTRQQHDVYRQVGQRRGDREVVLLGEDFGRGHEGPLTHQIRRP